MRREEEDIGGRVGGGGGGGAVVDGNDAKKIVKFFSFTKIRVKYHYVDASLRSWQFRFHDGKKTRGENDWQKNCQNCPENTKRKLKTL